MVRMLTFILFLGLLSACNRPPTHAFTKEIPNGEWPTKHRFEGEFTVEDTLNPHLFFVTLRNTADYPYSNVYLFLHTYFPNGKKSKDTIECVLTDRYGRWLGSGNGYIFDQKIISNKVLYQYQKKFPLAGDYRIEIEHAMRVDTLREILDIGVRVEQASR